MRDRPTLEFADLPPARMAVYPLADQFAEKLQAYTRPREDRTRVKDLVDLTAILEVLGEKLPPSQEMRCTIQATFDRYGNPSPTRPATASHRKGGEVRSRQPQRTSPWIPPI